MRWTKAVAHLVAIARDCGELNERLELFDNPARLASFWAYGEVLDGPDGWPGSAEFAAAALAFDVDPQQVPWFARPRDLAHAADMMGWSKRPVHLMFRSGALPVSNHHIVRPLRLWDAEAGVDEAAVETLEHGAPGDRREPAPDPETLRSRLEREREVSYAALARTTQVYDEKRWGPGKLQPYVEPMWEAAAGYVDLTEALDAR